MCGGEIQRRLTADRVFNHLLGANLAYRPCSGALAAVTQSENAVGEGTGHGSQVIEHIPYDDQIFAEQ